MKKMLIYKDFTGSVEPEEDGTLYGKVQNVGTLVSYEGRDEVELEKDFRDAVDDFLDYCAGEGIDPYNTLQAVKPLKSAQA